MEIQDIDIDLLIPYENNAKLHPDWQVKSIARSIEQTGFDVPLVVVPDGDKFLIVKGHGRRLAGLMLGMPKLPCYVSSLSGDIAIKAARLLDNKTQDSGYELEALINELEAISAIDEDIYTGYDEQEISDLISRFNDEDLDELIEEPTDSDLAEPQQNLELEQMPPLGDSDKVPLAIVLTQDEAFEWNLDKERLGYATDGKAFKEMWRQWKDNH